MAALMDGALAQRLRDEELARSIGKALGRNRPTIDDLPKFVRRDGRDGRIHRSVDARVEAPWGPFEKKRATSEDQRAARFEAAAIPLRSGVVVAPQTGRRVVRWPWIFAATVATSVAVQLVVPQWWPAVGQRAMQGVDDLRDALRARQSHDAPTLPVAGSAIATPPPDVDAAAEPPPPESPPGEVPELREPPPADVPTPIPTEGPTAQ